MNLTLPSVRLLLSNRQREVRGCVKSCARKCIANNEVMRVSLQGEVTFGLVGLQSLEQALALYKEIEQLPERRWAGSRKDGIKYCTAFGRFRDGLLRELVARATRHGEVRATEALEQERRATKTTTRHSQLQSLANKYYKAWKGKKS